MIDLNYMKDSQRGLAPIIVVLIIAIVLGGGYLAIRYFSSRPAVENITQSTYRNDKYGFSIQYTENVWVPADDIRPYFLSKDTNFEVLLALVEKSPLNGTQYINSDSGKLMPYNSNLGLESITFSIINKTLDDIRSSIPVHAFPEYESDKGDIGDPVICPTLVLPIYIGPRPSFCASSGFEWDEHVEYFYALGDRTLVVNWNFYSIPENVSEAAKKNFLDVMNTFKFTK